MLSSWARVLEGKEEVSVSMAADCYCWRVFGKDEDEGVRPSNVMAPSLRARHGRRKPQDHLGRAASPGPSWRFVTAQGGDIRANQISEHCLRSTLARIRSSTSCGRSRLEVNEFQIALFSQES